MADVELRELGDGGDRRDIVEGEAVARMRLDPVLHGKRGAIGDSPELGCPLLALGMGEAAGVELDHGSVEPQGGFDLALACGCLAAFGSLPPQALDPWVLIAELGLSAGHLGFLTAAYFLSFALFQIPLGLMLDRYGPRRVQAGLELNRHGQPAERRDERDRPREVQARQREAQSWLPRTKAGAMNGLPTFETLLGRLGARDRLTRSGFEFPHLPYRTSAPGDNPCTWDDIAWLRTLWDRKLLIKGVLSVPDAEKAAALGCDGIIASACCSISAVSAST